MMKFGFVILHYLTDNDTIECVQSILERFGRDDYEIVIVDNFSNNGSAERIQEKIRNNDRIHLLLNKENLGFAKGNNVGYSYCKNILKCDFILVLNNDIILDSHNLLSCVVEDWENRDAAVIGPDIVSLVDHGHQNPMKVSDFSNRNAVKKDILRYQVLLVLNNIGIYDFMLRLVGNHSNSPSISETYITKISSDCQLHGAFIIFTPTFVKEMDIAFCPETFMYMEESILFQICKNKDFKTLYDPRITVFHKEDSATNALNIKSRDKRNFVFSNIIKSSRILLKYL